MDLNVEQIVADMRQKIVSRPASIEDSFIEHEYLDLYPDVQSAVAAGTYRSGYDHWIRTGRAQGRRTRKHLWRSAQAVAEIRSQTPPLSVENIGEPTPLRNTVRARLAHAVMWLMAKALWWYSYRIKQTLNEWRTVEVGAFEALEEGIRKVSTQLAADLHGMAARQEDLRKEGIKIGARLEALQQGFRELVAQQDDLRKGVEALQAQSARSKSLEARIAEVTKTAYDNGTIHIPNLANRIAELGLYTNQTRAELSLQERRLSLLLEEVRRSMQQSSTDVSRPAVNLDDGHAGLYVGFEAAFRGTREEIRKRQRIYIPMLHDARAGQPDRPVVDLGCGRGEWLELLRSEGMQAAGADTNESMVEMCRALGMTTILSDALSYLRGLPDSSVGAVTAFHLVEHLPFDAMLALVDESIRVLKPDGILILETPNPGNLLVGAQYFYLDPTHNRPLPSPMLRFFVEARGMCRVNVLELHPYPESVRVPEDGGELAKRFNDYFYGARDYAVIARRP